MISASKDAWLIVGLGNPGREYENSRHNCGFRAIDRLAGRLGCKIDKAKFQGLYGKTQYGGKPLYLLKLFSSIILFLILSEISSQNR